MREIVVATLKSGTGQVGAVLCAVVSVKVLAVFAGPAGVGLFSLLRQIQQTLCALASLGSQNAVVQVVASRHGSDRDRVAASVLWVFAGSVAIVVLCTLLLSSQLATLVFGGDDADAKLIRWLVVPVALGAILIFFRGLLIAHMQIGAVAWVNFATAFGSLLMVFPAAVAYGTGHKGALILILCASFGLGLLVAVHQVLRHGCLPALVSDEKRYDGAVLREYLTVALPSLAALFIGMGCVLAVRAAIARLHGLPLAGQFDAAWSISVTFLVVFLTSLQTYLLPKLSAARTEAESQDVLHDALRLSAMIAVPVISSLIVLKPVAIHLLYSGEFIDALKLLRWTLLGDYVRVSGWVLATTLVARADMRAYLVCEIIWNTLFAIASFWLLPSGIAGAGPAYVGAYVIYLSALVWRVCGRHSIVFRPDTILQWLSGVAIVLLASVVTWTDTAFQWPSLGVIACAALFGWVIMRAAERRFVVSWLARWLVRAQKVFAGSWKR